MRRRLLLIALAGFLACGRAPEARRQAREARRQEQERYAAPADGRLSPDQIRAFLAVAREEVAVRTGAPSPTPGGDPFFEPEVAAVRKLGLNLEEHLWVKQRIVEAEILSDEIDARRKNAETYRRTLASLRAAAAAGDPATRETVHRQISELEQEAAANERALRQPPPAAAAANLALVARFRKDLDAARRRAGRP